MEFTPRIFQPPSQSYFLFGPRGTGKSTWVSRHYPDAIVVDLLEPQNRRRYQSRPERLRERIDATDAGTCVVDEVQKVPELLDVVHGLIEEDDRHLDFVLTGSSARKLRRGGVNLTGGRIVKRTLHPFMACELGDQFNLQEALQTGLVPLVLDAEDPGDTLSGYIDLYMRDEISLI